MGATVIDMQLDTGGLTEVQGSSPVSSTWFTSISVPPNMQNAVLVFAYKGYAKDWNNSDISVSANPFDNNGSMTGHNYSTASIVVYSEIELRYVHICGMARVEAPVTGIHPLGVTLYAYTTSAKLHITNMCAILVNRVDIANVQTSGGPSSSPSPHVFSLSSFSSPPVTGDVCISAGLAYSHYEVYPSTYATNDSTLHNPTGEWVSWGKHDGNMTQFTHTYYVDGSAFSRNIHLPGLPDPYVHVPLSFFG